MKGDLDEWGAVQKHRQEVYERQKHEEALQKQLHMKDYHKELTDAVLNKRQQVYLDQQAKEQEREVMNRNIEARQEKDLQNLSAYLEQKHQVGVMTKQQMAQNQHLRALQDREKRDNDNELLQRDRNAAFLYEQNRRRQAEVQRQ